MAENTKEKTSAPFSIQEPPPSIDDQISSARILFQEGLLEEAKKILHKILMARSGHPRTLELLKQIRESEWSALIRTPAPAPRAAFREDPEKVIAALEKDFGIEIFREAGELDSSVENWKHPEGLAPEDAFDLGVAFFEMGCYRDAIRQLKEAVRAVRVRHSSLGAQGSAAAALCAEAMILLGEAYEAAAWMIPILNELDLTTEEKIPFFYLMGRAEELQNHRKEARAWYRRVLEMDPLYRDAPHRIRIK